MTLATCYNKLNTVKVWTEFNKKPNLSTGLVVLVFYSQQIFLLLLSITIYI